MEKAVFPVPYSSSLPLGCKRLRKLSVPTSLSVRKRTEAQTDAVLQVQEEINVISFSLAIK
jgi:hypothetical protein